MGEVIKIIKDKLVISSKEAEFLYNFKENLTSLPCGRRYTDEVKEFA